MSMEQKATMGSGNDSEGKSGNENMALREQQALALVNSGKYAEVMDLMLDIMEHYPKFFKGSTIERDYFEYKEEFDSSNEISDKADFIEKVFNPFWEKVKAEGAEIHSSHFEDLENTKQ